VQRAVRFALNIWRAFGFERISAYLATRPAKAVGEEARWEQATASLRNALSGEHIPYEVDEGGGAFYGPKIDLKVRDAIGREWQMSTIQFDFNMPERFELSYIGEDGAEHRPYMVHRALLGSLGRFLGVLIEHYGGAFPLWLAPEQVRVLPLDREAVAGGGNAGGAAAGGGPARGRGPALGEARRQDPRRAAREDPVHGGAGGREVEAGTVAVRARAGGDLGAHGRGCLRAAPAGRSRAQGLADGSRDWLSRPAKEGDVHSFVHSVLMTESA